MTVAAERGDQIVELALRIMRLRQAGNGILDGLAADQQGGAHLGPHRSDIASSSSVTVGFRMR
jgi:hypothetical protein